MSERIELIKQLRERTGAGLRDCKKALLANGNDVDKSVDWLREKGIAKQAKKAATRIAAEGVGRKETRQLGLKSTPKLTSLPTPILSVL